MADVYQMQDIRPDGTVLMQLTYTEWLGPPEDIYRLWRADDEADGPWKRQARLLPDGEWQTLGGRMSDGSRWRQQAGMPCPERAELDWVS